MTGETLSRLRGRFDSRFDGSSVDPAPEQLRLVSGSPSEPIIDKFAPLWRGRPWTLAALIVMQHSTVFSPSSNIMTETARNAIWEEALDTQQRSRRVNMCLWQLFVLLILSVI